jgi:hypothetical protein
LAGRLSLRSARRQSRTGGLKVIDLGAGHSSSGETLCGRVIAALKSEALLTEAVGAGYIERSWAASPTKAAPGH